MVDLNNSFDIARDQTAYNTITSPIRSIIEATDQANIAHDSAKSFLAQAEERFGDKATVQPTLGATLLH